MFFTLNPSLINETLKLKNICSYVLDWDDKLFFYSVSRETIFQKLFSLKSILLQVCSPGHNSQNTVSSFCGRSLPKWHRFYKVWLMDNFFSKVFSPTSTHEENFYHSFGHLQPCGHILCSTHTWHCSKCYVCLQVLILILLGMNMSLELYLTLEA